MTIEPPPETEMYVRMIERVLSISPKPGESVEDLISNNHVQIRSWVEMIWRHAFFAGQASMAGKVGEKYLVVTPEQYEEIQKKVQKKVQEE